MIYKFKCKKCGQFDHSMLMKDYQAEIDCPTCKGRAKRDLANDLPTKVMIDMGPKTLGALADKNADKYSKDYKDRLTKKHNEYRVPKEDLSKYWKE